MTTALRQFRHKTGQTQEQLADALKVKPSAVSNYETGRRQPEVSVAYRFIDHAAKYGCSYSLADIYPRPRRQVRRQAA